MTFLLAQARVQPESHAKLVEYFLETESGEMQYEAARMRPKLTEEFFAFLAEQISKLLPPGRGHRVPFNETDNHEIVAE